MSTDDDYYQPELWEGMKGYEKFAKPSKTPHPSSKGAKSRPSPYDQAYEYTGNHEINVIKDMVKAIMNTLDEIKGYIDDQAEMLDDIVYVLYKDDE